ncbi:MAG TPA: hypothetical protein VFW52_00600 [Candidatus Saccharimonadales bacterium]|nr:hypothetical protein [Candidatus Saccharimonadales bacterium]
MSSKNKHETHKSNTRYNKYMALGVSALALAGMTGKGKDIISNAYHPHKQPVRTMKFENVGPKGATVYEQIGDKPSSRVEIGEAAVAYEVQPGDTEFSIAGKLFPDKDPREVAYGMIDPQLPKADRADHVVRPGQILEFKSE